MAKNKINILYLFTVLALSGVPISCGDDAVVATGQNNPPVIENIVVAPQVFAVNRFVTFAAIAMDPDGDELTYTWETEFGILIPDASSTKKLNKSKVIAEGANVVWRPDRGGTQEVILTVSDGKDHTIERLSFFVEPTK